MRRIGPGVALKTCQAVDLNEAQKRDGRFYQAGPVRLRAQTLRPFCHGRSCPIAGTNERGLVLIKDGRRSTMSFPPHPPAGNCGRAGHRRRSRRPAPIKVQRQSRTTTASPRANPYAERTRDAADEHVRFCPPAHEFGCRHVAQAIRGEKLAISGSEQSAGVLHPTPPHAFANESTSCALAPSPVAPRMMCSGKMGAHGKHLFHRSRNEFATCRTGASAESQERSATICIRRCH